MLPKFVLCGLFKVQYPTITPSRNVVLLYFMIVFFKYTAIGSGCILRCKLNIARVICGHLLAYNQVQTYTAPN